MIRAEESVDVLKNLVIEISDEYSFDIEKCLAPIGVQLHSNCTVITVL